MESRCMCAFILLYYHAGVSSESSCGASRNVTGVVGGEVTLYADDTGISEITFVRVENFKPIAVIKPGNVIEDIISSYKGRLKATHNGSLVITDLTREDQGSYKATVRRSSPCSYLYHLAVYDKQYNRTWDDTTSSHNSSSEFSDKQYNSTSNDTKSSHDSSSVFLGWPHHLLTKLVPAVIVVLVVVTAILAVGYRQKLHPQHMCMSNNTPREADDKEGSVWKINDIYNIESATHRIEDSSVQ